VPDGAGDGRWYGSYDRVGPGDRSRVGRIAACGGADGEGAPAADAGDDDGGDGAGDVAGGVVNTWDTSRITDEAASFGDCDVANSVSEPVRSAATPNPAAARPSEAQGRRRLSSAQRAWRADGLGPLHDEDPRSISVRMSWSSSRSILIGLPR
jgi:hypothetical protein